MSFVRTGRSSPPPCGTLLLVGRSVQIGDDGARVALYHNTGGIWAAIMRADDTVEYVEVAVNPNAPPVYDT